MNKVSFQKNVCLVSLFLCMGLGATENDQACLINILPTPGKVERLDGFCPLSATNEIVFQPAEQDLGPEGYVLQVLATGIVIRAETEAGTFYARQSLKQLINHAPASGIPCVKVIDQPKYKWRSFMLDSGRQYQRVETIKGLLDRMALLKMNVFHWHLTENDGWRIEIKKYPKLTAIGAFVADGPEQQGFYTQDEVREIVQYAADRHIMVVPEIDVPGHSDAAIMAYPELSCAGEQPKPVEGFSPYLFCGGRESTYTFLTAVLDELCEIFPAQYIHIGGDEAPKSEWEKCAECQAEIKALGLKDEHELQIELANRLARHLALKGRNAVCWGDLVTQPGPALESNIVIHWWSYRYYKDKALREAIRRNKLVIGNSNFYTYLNFPQKHAWKKYREDRLYDLKICYENNPSDIVNPTDEERKALLGMGCCIWTNHGLTESWLDLRLFPRAFALAEQMWSTADRLPYEEFKFRVYSKRPILEELGIGGDWLEQY